MPSEQSQLYSAALHQLVLVDSPFAKAPSAVKYVYIVDGAASRSPELVIDADEPPFDSDTKNEIAALSDGLPPIEFITSPEERADPGRVGLGVENDGVIVGLTPAQRQDDGTVHVGAGLWCGMECGIGLTYIIDNIDGTWTVTGTTGPVIIS
ncbi:hypothetical protein [Rhodococcus spongiicola]|nr:hypothetical protein [Rhodococcus spongiicola]